MEKRIFNKTGEKISLLGFGMMRLPKIDPEKSDIDYEAGQKMVDHAIAHGVNYFDTAYPYHEGKSEPFTGHALAKYDRESFFVASKMPTWELKTKDDAPRIFKTQLERLQMDYIDFYLCHAIGSSLEDYIARYEDTGAIDYLDSLKKEGKIKNLGFSFHGEYPVMEQLLERHGGVWDFVQIQANYLDWDTQNAKKLYEILEAKNIPCIIMEPVRGGMLANLCDESVKILKAAEPEKSVASWAMRFAATLPNVLTVLSGMSNFEQLADNLDTIENFAPLKDNDYTILNNALAAFLGTGSIPCTTCRYCMDCPSGVDIPKVFDIYNKCAAEHQLPVSFGDDETIKESAKFFNALYSELAPENRADKCTECKICLEHCPQSIKIPERMRSIARMAEGIAAL